MNDPMREIALMLADLQSLPRPKNTKQWRALRDEFKKMAKICGTEAGRIRRLEIASHQKETR